MLAALLGILAGCQKDQIAVYEVPHVDPHAGHNHDMASQGTAASPHGAASMETPAWTLPEGWLGAGASDMLAGRIHIPGPAGMAAKVAVMPFKRMNELDFLNVLRASMQMEPVGPDALPGMVESVQIGDTQGQLFDITKDAAESSMPNDSHVVVAMLPRGDTSWFFKLGGDAALVEANRDKFVTFLKSVTFQAASLPETTSTAPASSPDLPQWTVPDHWQQVAATTMLLAKFQLSGNEGATAEVTVSSFPGDVGGLLANINRWRGQVGLGPITDQDLAKTVTPLDTPEGPASVVDVTGPGAEGDETRLVGVIHPYAGKTWFYKMMGDAGVAGAEKEAFLEFVKSVRHNNG